MVDIGFKYSKTKLNASKPSEHPLNNQEGNFVEAFRWGHSSRATGGKDKTSWDRIGFPNSSSIVTLV